MNKAPTINVNGMEIKIRALRYMKRLGAIRSDGMYYYPEDEEYAVLYRIGQINNKIPENAKKPLKKTVLNEVE